MGKKFDYDQDLADEICELIIAGETIRDICALEHMPSVKTFFKWLRENEDTFGKQYARAKEEQAEIMVQEMNAIADDARNDWMEKQLQNGGTVEVVNHEHIQRSKLRIDTRKWIASKFRPKKYGDRMIHAGDPEAPLNTDGIKKSDREAMARFLQNHPDRAKAMTEQPTEESNDHDDLC